MRVAIEAAGEVGGRDDGEGDPGNSGKRERSGRRWPGQVRTATRCIRLSSPFM